MNSEFRERLTCPPMTRIGAIGNQLMALKASEVRYSETPLRMDLAVALPTESDEVFFNVVAQHTARGDVVNF